ncbi:FUSC family protein [Jannaschia sp. S6380]|uniref:FUSC family protein n=1 Tax=Jannaschia sp. S6380 TaxID=2926408 RepID=UPI001FF5CF1D|nr:FUSC family protein [Jannaschia sp. S6380]MCK0169278.1 FUSC family protein [Jannaschia sp. S6380]
MRLPVIGPTQDLDRAQLRDAARLSLQAATGALLTWLALRGFLADELFVGILAAVLIVQPSIGGTMGAAGTRLTASLVGCAVGAACIAIFPPGWATAAGLVTSMAILNAVAVFRPAWTYGIVCAVALSLTEGDAIWWSALERMAAIGIGAVIGVAVVWIVWPDSAEHRFRRHMRSTLDAMADLVDEVAARTARSEAPQNRVDDREVARRLALAEEAADALKLADRDPLQTRLSAAREMRDAIRFLDRAAAVPRDLGQDADLAELLDRFRAAVADRLRAFARDAQPDFDGTVTQAQRDVTRRIEEGRTDDPRSGTVLAFAMDEIDRALAALRDAGDRGDTPDRERA